MLCKTTLHLANFCNSLLTLRSKSLRNFSSATLTFPVHKNFENRPKRLNLKQASTITQRQVFVKTKIPSEKLALI